MAQDAGSCRCPRPHRVCPGSMPKTCPVLEGHRLLSLFSLVELENRSGVWRLTQFRKNKHSTRCSARRPASCRWSPVVVGRARSPHLTFQRRPVPVPPDTLLVSHPSLPSMRFLQTPSAVCAGFSKMWLPTFKPFISATLAVASLMTRLSVFSK